MSDDKNVTKKDISPAAQRALDEAVERRAQQVALEEKLETERAREKGGPKHSEPTRFGDWERGGRAIDF